MADIFDQLAGQSGQGAASPGQTPQPQQQATPAQQGTGDIFDQLSTGAISPTGQPATGTSTKAAIPNSLHIDPNDSLGMKVLKGANSVGAGIGTGVLSTINDAMGLEDRVAKHLPHGLASFAFGDQDERTQAEQLLQSRKQELQQQNSENPTLNTVGYGGETLMEFLLGDEALKGLSLADKLSKSAAIAKALENSPRLMQALKLGAAAGKAGTELGPEEAALLAKYPVLARLAGAGMDAIRAGTVQGGQTIEHGGNVRQAARDAGVMAGTSGVLGAATGAAAGVLGKGARAARTVEQMRQIAETAPTSADVSGQLADTVNGAFGPQRTAAANQLDSATGTITDLAQDAKGNPEITANAQSFARDAQKAMHDKYAAGVADLAKFTDGQTIPYVDSPLHKAAQAIAEKGSDDTKPLDEAFSQTRPGSPRANRMVDILANAGPDDGVDLDTNELIQRRQQLGERMRSLGWATGEDRADRAIYQKLIGGIDDTIGQIANQTGNPQATQLLGNMNSDYRKSIGLFKNRDVKALLTGNVNDVSQRLMRGETSLADINAVKQTLGDDNFQQLGSDSLKRIAADSIAPDGTLDLKGLVRRWSKINPDVRAAMFGDDADTFHNALTQATGATGQLKNVTDTVGDLLGNGNVDSLLKDPQRLQAVASAVGPDGMKALGQSVLESKIAEASTTLDPKTGQIVKSKFNPDQVLSWWSKLKDSPEARDALFTVDAPAAQRYNRMMSDLSQAASVKKLVKYGVLPLTFGTAGVVHGAVPALVGALLGLGAEGFGSARNLLDHIANSPAMWKSLETAGNVANSQAGAVAGKAARYGAGSAAIYSGVADALGGQQPQQQQSQPQQ
jgi:hypothetical protein